MCRPAKDVEFFLKNYTTNNILPLFISKQPRISVMLPSESTTCQNPTIIINRSSLVFWERTVESVGFVNVTICGQSRISYLSSPTSIVDIIFHRYSPKRLGIEKKDLDTSYLLNEVTGEICYIYMLTACGKCDDCRYKKSLEWSHRIDIEAANYNFPPLFITLTYDNEHLPEDGVNKKDCQDFLKRLRINFQRHGYKQKIRYFLCAEYGHNTHRPHYHAIIFGLPSSNSYTFYELIKCSWQNGFVRCEIPRSASRYCTKYMCKFCYVPAGKNDVFFLRSLGLGRWVIPSLSAHYAKTLTQPFQVLSKFNQRILTVHPCSYFIDKIFPKFSTLCPPELRAKCSLFTEFNKILNKHYFTYDVQFMFSEIKVKFNSFCQSSAQNIDAYYKHLKSSIKDSQLYIDNILTEFTELYNYLIKQNFNYENFLSSLNSRNLFIGLLRLANPPKSQFNRQLSINKMKFEKLQLDKL